MVKRRQRGFTMVELMVAVAIIAILASLAAPSIKTLIANQRLRAASAELYAALARTRSEAVKLNRDVTMSPVGGSWEAGWNIANPAGGTAFETHAALTGVTISAVAPEVVFGSNGRSKSVIAPLFNLAATNTTEVRCVGLDPSGRPYQKKTTC